MFLKNYFSSFHRIYSPKKFEVVWKTRGCPFLSGKVKSDYGEELYQ